MNTLEFLTKILPQSGWYVATIIEEKRTSQRFFPTVGELSQAVLLLDEGGFNTYMAVNSFREKGNRRQDNVAACRSLYIDIDCGEGKPYPDQAAGLAALKQFVVQAKLPMPMIVSSGRGLHCYWVFDKDVSPDEWQPLADALKRKTVELAFEVDPVATADSARILRPVGTFNPKNGAIVEVLYGGAPTTYDTLRLLLAPSAALNRLHVPPVRKTTLLDNLAVKQEFPPGNADVIAAKCQQISWASANQNEVQEPMWYAVLGVAAFTQDPEVTAKAWSDQHKDYNPGKTLAKLQQWQRATGPSLCAKFEELRPEGCKGCPFKDKVKTPVALGAHYAAAPPPEDAPVEEILPMPWPFKRTVAGIKMEFNDVDLDVCKFDVIPMGYGYDEGLGYETVRFLWKRPHVGWRELKMRQALLAEGNRDFPTIIADQGIVLYNKKQTENFQFMLRSYMEELRKAQTMSNLHSTMGWKENNTQFVLGDTIYIRQEDGSVVKQDVKSSARTSSIESLYTSKGSLENWSAFTKILDNPSMAATQFALGASFSSVLYKFTGLKGLTLSLYGPKGTGKTLTQYYMQSIWGDPTKLHFAAKFTQNALYSRMAYHNNLIFTVDEATLMEAKDVGDFVYTVTQGRDKARLSRAAEEREAKTWETLACVSTNRSLVGSIGTTYGYEGDAQLSRLLEIEMQPSPIFAKSSEGGRTIYRRIHQDFGVAGPVFIEYLLSLGEAGIQARVDEAMRTFGVRYGVTFAGHERFWETSIVLVDLALQIADELGLIKFNWRVAIEFVLRQINASRVAAQVSKADAFDVIAAYAADYASKAVTLMHTVGDNRPSYDNDAMSRTSEIRVRYDVFRTTKKDPFTHGTITFDRVHFRSWLSKHGGDYKSFVDELTSEKAIATPKSGKLCLGKDTPYRLPQTYVVAANISHPKLKHLLNNIDDDIMNNMLGQLSVVQN